MIESNKKTSLVHFLKKLQQKQISSNNIIDCFPEVFTNLTENEISVEDYKNRIDFTKEKAFTLDCESCKDMDDAVCIKKTMYGYKLSVHIADVSSYITPFSELEQLAVSRTTSFYFPGITIPMLPKILSENLCSLNPNVERLTLSVTMKINHDGKLIDYAVNKGKIISRVKGIYSEVNKLLNGSRSINLLLKYQEVYDELFHMKELYRLLRNERIKRGSIPENNERPNIKVSETDIIVTPIKRGVAEKAIEEFMVLANHAIALYLTEHNLPAIFRIQDADNDMASYCPSITQHKSLCLESYVHFTSPIRRCSDLFIHQILSMHLNGYSHYIIHEVFDSYLPSICVRVTKRSRTAKQVQAICEKYCYETYIEKHKNKRYEGTIVGFDKQNNPVVRIDELKYFVCCYVLNNATIGERISFFVSLYEKTKKYSAYGVKRLLR